MYDLDTYCWFQDFVLGLVEHTLTLKMHELSGPHWQLYAQRERERPCDKQCDKSIAWLGLLYCRYKI